MRDDDTPCCSAEQQAWLELIKAIRTHMAKHVDKKPKVALTTLGGLIELTSYLMQLHVAASSFDEACEAKRAKHKKRIQSCE